MNKLLFRVIESTQRHAPLVIMLTAVLTVALGWFALHIRVNPEISTLIPESPKSLRLILKYGRESLTAPTSSSSPRSHPTRLCPFSRLPRTS